MDMPPVQSPNSYQVKRSSFPVAIAVVLGCCGGGFVLIMVLAALLFPVFAQARDKAREITCISNLKQIGLATMMYSQDYDERFPPGDWMDSVKPYVKNEQIFHCPSVTKNLDSPSFGYAYNSHLIKASLSKISVPNRVYLIFDSTDLTRNAVSPGDNVASARHLGGANYAFADGHAMYLKPVEIATKGGFLIHSH